MSVERNKAVIRQYFQRCWNQGDLDFANEIMIADYDLHLPRGIPGGRQTWRAGVTHFLTVFHELHFENLQLIAEGEFVAVRSVMHMVHGGPFMGVEPTGRRLSVPCADYYQLSDGKMIGHWDVPDLFSLLKQLGVLPDQIIANLPYPGMRDPWSARD